MHPEVIKTMTEVMSETFGNPSSVHSFGRQAAGKLEMAREVIGKSLGVKYHEIVFNSGGTEGDNTAILETAFGRQNEGRHLITTQIEHPAVINTMKYLETQGFEVTYLPVDRKGNISLADFDASLRPDTILVSIMYGNNEIGNLMPIKSDAAKLAPLLRGGEQEEKRRAGTENLAGICGMAKAVELLTEDEREKRGELYDQFIQKVLTTLDQANIDYHVNGDVNNKLPHVLNLRFTGIISDLLLMKLDLRGIAVSTGSACTAGTVDPSHVLEAMYGKNAPEVKESLRASFGYGNSLEQVEYFAEQLVASLQELTK